MIILFLSIIFALLLSVILLIWNFDRQTEKLLMKHQKEWDKIRSKLEQKGATDFEIDEAYLQYIQHLINNRDSCYGACFPPRQ